MDPFTLAMLAAGGVGAASGVAGTLANNPAQRLNRERLDELLNLQRAGGLGLTSTEQRLMSQQATDPVRRESTANRSRMEQLMAAAGGSASGADLSRLRVEEQRNVGDAVQNAAMMVRGADLAKEQAQLNEIEARTGAKSQMRADDIASITSAASSLAGPLGLAAGAPPGTTQQGPLMGQQGAGSAAAWTPQQVALLRQLEPEQLASIMGQLPPEVVLMLQQGG